MILSLLFAFRDPYFANSWEARLVDECDDKDADDIGSYKSMSEHFIASARAFALPGLVTGVYIAQRWMHTEYASSGSICNRAIKILLAMVPAYLIGLVHHIVVLALNPNPWVGFWVSGIITYLISIFFAGVLPILFEKCSLNSFKNESK